MKPVSTAEMRISKQQVETEQTPSECNFQAHGFATETREVAQKLNSEADNEACRDHAEVEVCSVQSTAEPWDQERQELLPAEVHKSIPPTTVRGASPVMVRNVLYKGSPVLFI